MHGYGILIFKDKRRYEGQFANDKREGKGIFDWNDGRRYDGMWKQGK